MVLLSFILLPFISMFRRMFTITANQPIFLSIFIMKSENNGKIKSIYDITPKNNSKNVSSFPNYLKTTLFMLKTTFPFSLKFTLPVFW